MEVIPLILYMEDVVHPFLGWNSYLLLDIVNGRWSASIYGEKSMLEPMSLESNASWRKEIKLLLSEKNLSLATCVILIMLISSQMIFSFHDLIDNGNSTKKWYTWSVCLKFPFLQNTSLMVLYFSKWSSYRLPLHA